MSNVKLNHALLLRWRGKRRSDHQPLLTCSVPFAGHIGLDGRLTVPAREAAEIEKMAVWLESKYNMAAHHAEALADNRQWVPVKRVVVLEEVPQ